MVTVIALWGNIWVIALLDNSYWLGVLKKGMVRRDVYKWGFVSSQVSFWDYEHSLKNFWLVLLLNIWINIVKILSPNNNPLFRSYRTFTAWYLNRSFFPIHLIYIPIFCTNHIQTPKQRSYSWQALRILRRPIVSHQHGVITIKSNRSQILCYSEHKVLCCDFLNFWLSLLWFIYISDSVEHDISKTWLKLLVF